MLVLIHNPTYVLICIQEILLSENILMRKMLKLKFLLRMESKHIYLVMLHLHLTLLTPGCPGYSFSVRFSAACSYDADAGIAAVAELLNCFSPGS